MSIMTVCGPISAEQLGRNASHEHLFCDVSSEYIAPPPELTAWLDSLGCSLEELEDPRIHGILLRQPNWSRRNLQLDDYDTLLAELRWLKRAGYDSLIDPTSNGMSPRRPLDLRSLAQSSGIQIITGTGYYRHRFHPPHVATASIAALIEDMERDLTCGIEGTDVRAGVIGELGTTWQGIAGSEEKVLIAAADINRRLNTPIMVHTEGRTNYAVDAIELLVRHGANPRKIHICHVTEVPYWEDILRTGVSIGLDNFGYTFSDDVNLYTGTNDQEQIALLKSMIDAGYGDRILLGNDICMQMRFHQYGGWGYDHIATNLTAYMLRAGITEEQLRALFVENPARFLDSNLS